MFRQFQIQILEVMQLFCFVLIFSFGVNNTIQASDQNLDSLLTVANAIENDSNRLKAFFDIAQNYRTINADTAIYLLKDIIEKSSDGKFSNMYYNATLLLSNAYQNIGNYTEAINLVLELLKLYEKEGDIDKQTKCLLDLGELCRASQQFDAGIAYLNQVIRITKKTKNLKLLCFAYNRLSAIYYEYPNPELTLAYIDSAISKCEEISYIELMPTNLDILGAAYSMQKDYARAIPTYFKSIEINNSFGEDEEDNINTYINLARAYYYTEKYDSALIFAQKAFSFANESNIPIYEENSAFLLSLIYSATDDYKNAFNFLNSTMNIRNFLFNKEKNSQISELNKKFETEKKEKEIKNQKLIIRNKEIYNSFLIVSIFFLLALILGILFFVVNTKKKNKLLEDKNAEIAAQRDELQYFADELEKANKQKDRFFSIIAHDLKSPFSSLLGLSELLKESLEDFDPDEVKEIAGAIYKSSDNTFKLLINLLEWSRTQTNKIVYEATQFKINKVIQSNIELNEIAANAKSLKLIFKPEEDIDVFADLEMLNSILRNLITNAIKFTSTGKIIIQAKKAQEKCIISVEDTGVGISEEMLDKIFQLDETISTAGTNGETGTGLGLILCKEFVEMNHGKISVESTLNKGSKFSFTLPLAKAPS